ncbi:hypothetical protein K438DRAFT_2000567 [Mycena galopus ATCC 62051]|nr:hypothetical protein K438DRAFT_2000567 [Mycena galopus ATCC 62051]
MPTSNPPASHAPRTLNPPSAVHVPSPNLRLLRKRPCRTPPRPRSRMPTPRAPPQAASTLLAHANPSCVHARPSHPSQAHTRRNLRRTPRIGPLPARPHQPRTDTSKPVAPPRSTHAC